MPNLNEIYRLKEKFYQLSNKDKSVRDFIEKTKAKDVIIKAFDPRTFNEDTSKIRIYKEDTSEIRKFSFVYENLNPSKPDLIKYFDEGKKEDVALLFIDITSFSETISDWTNAQIKEYLDEYYEKIIPLIYKYGGEIEKLMGDGIICVFGKPFLNLDDPEYVYKAEDCAKAVIKEFYNSNKNVKVAIHKGQINYYKVPGEFYGEYTMIGQPITEIYRLESVSKPNAINFFVDSTYDKLGWTKSRFNNDIVLLNTFNINKLQGVNFKQVKYMLFPEYN